MTLEEKAPYTVIFSFPLCCYLQDIFTVVRGFLGRRRFQYLKRQAALEAERVRILMLQIQQTSQTADEKLRKVLQQDRDIPKGITLFN